MYKCAQIWVSALFSTFLRCFAPRELAKLVGLQNLFRDLGFFFLSLKLFPLHKSEGVYLEERESGELGMCKSATPTFVKREWKCIKTLILGFYWNYLWLSSQLFHVMCDLFSFTPTRQACGLERLHLLGRGDRAGGITSSAHSSGVSQSISLTKSKEKA